LLIFKETDKMTELRNEALVRGIGNGLCSFSRRQL